MAKTEIPAYKIVGESARLFCQYNLEGDKLYSVKWFKGDDEFYRYIPRDVPPAQIFLLPGVSVNVSQKYELL